MESDESDCIFSFSSSLFDFKLYPCDTVIRLHNDSSVCTALKQKRALRRELFFAIRYNYVPEVQEPLVEILQKFGVSGVTQLATLLEVAVVKRVPLEDE